MAPSGAEARGGAGGCEGKMAVSDGGGASGAEAGYQVHIATALDEGLGGSALLSQLHERAPELSMQEMQRELLAAQATEDSALFDLIAENYRDFFRLAQSLDTSAEVRPRSSRFPHHDCCSFVGDGGVAVGAAGAPQRGEQAGGAQGP